MSSPVPVNHTRNQSRRVQNNEAVMWTGVRTSGSTVNRMNTTCDDYSQPSVGDRQQSRNNPMTTASDQQRSPSQFHMPIISGSQNTNIRIQQQTNEPDFQDAQYGVFGTERTEMTTTTKRASRSKLKTIDYSDISLAMLKEQQQQNRGKRRGEENDFGRVQHQLAGNARFNSIDTKFKHDIDMMRARERKNNGQLPPNIANLDQSYDPNQTYPDQYSMPRVNQSLNQPQDIGFRLTPKRLKVSENIIRANTFTDKQGKLKTPNAIRRPPVPAIASGGPQSTKSSTHTQPVPNILLSMGGKREGVTEIDNRKFSNPDGSNISPRILPGGHTGKSFMSKDPHSTAYTHASIGHASGMSSTHGSELPKIGSANPNKNADARRTSQQPRIRMHSTQYNKAEMQERRIFSSGEQPAPLHKTQYNTGTVSRNDQQTSNQSSERPQTNHGINPQFRGGFSGSQGRNDIVTQYKNTGFNWKKVDIRPRGVFEDKPTVPKGKKREPIKPPKRLPGQLPSKEEIGSRKATPPPSYGAMLSELASTNKKMSHKIVSRMEFDRLAALNEKDGQPMVEKTIFIVKPIYVQTELPVAKKKNKKRAQTKKQIYTEKMRPPDYSQKGSSAQNQMAVKLKKKFKGHNRSIDDHSPRERVDQKSLMNLKHEASKEGSKEHIHKDKNTSISKKQAQLNRTFQEEYKDRSLNLFQDSKMSGISDFKNLLESSHIIDEIFHQRSITIERNKELERDGSLEIDNKSPSLQGSAEDSVENKSNKVKSPFRQVSQSPSYHEKSYKKKRKGKGRSSTGSIGKNSNPMLIHNRSVDSKHHPKIQEFQEKCNDSLTSGGAGIQIIMQESKDAYFFQKKQLDMEKIASGTYNAVRQWTVNPGTIEQTEAPDMMTAKERAKFERKRARELKKQTTATGSVLDKSGSIRNSPENAIHQSQKGINQPRGQNNSLDRFRDSRSGEQLSVDNQTTGKMPKDGNKHNRSAYEAAEPFLNKSTSYEKGERKSNKSIARSKETNSQYSPDLKSAVNVQDQQSKMTKATKNKGALEKNQLTHERVHALRLFTKDLLNKNCATPREKSIPVEVNNQFCSHVSPKVSAHLIQGNDLNALDEKNPYRFWADRDRKTREEHFNHVPKHFYTNYKTSLMRDAHEVAKVVASGLSDGDICGHEEQFCDCKKSDANKLHRLNLRKQWKSRSKMSRKQKKDNIQTAYELHKPYRPCRRSCSSTHNPLFHAQRMHSEHMQRLHQSATKLMIMSVIPERPKSADSTEEARKAYLREIDYTGSVMYSEVLRRKSLKEGKKAGGQNVDNISEQREEDEDEQMLGLPGKTSKNRSLLELQGQESQISIARGPMEAENENCYSGIEVEYLRSLLKNKSAMAQQSRENELDQIYTKARKTLKVAMKKLLLKRQFYHIDTQYKLAENEKQTAANILKLLTRCQKMFEAQTEITKVLMLIHQRIDKLMTLKLDLKAIEIDDKGVKIIKKLYTDLVRLSSRIYIAIATLKDNEKALARPFIFARNQYDEDWMHKQMKSLRLKILEKCPQTAETNELKMFLTKGGDVSDIRKLQKSEFEKDSEEESSTSSSDEDEKIEDDSIGKSISLLNDRSEFGRAFSKD